MLPDINIDSRYLYTESGTSDGTQVKYFYENKWYKIDRYGGEGAAEELASAALRLSGLSKDKYVEYERITINGDPGCVSDSFLKDDSELFVSIYRLYSNITGRDPATVTAGMDYDEAIDHILAFVLNNTGVDITEYLADTFTLDALILNEDRHFNNLGLIYNGAGYRPAPIFDNGKSLFIGNDRYDPDKPITTNRKYAFAKAFSGSFEQNRRYLSDHATFKPDYEAIRKHLKTQDLSSDTVYSRLLTLIR